MPNSPEETRQHLLDVAFEEIHLKGFQAASIAKILDNTKLTKGALYHHFKNKNTLGYAVVEEVIRPEFIRKWIEPLESSDQPVETIQQILLNMKEELEPEMLRRGCPVNNLMQEMSPIDDGFRDRLQSIIDLWIKVLTGSFKRGQAAGNIRPDQSAEQIAQFIILIIEGASSLTKNAQDLSVMENTMPQFIYYLNSLKA